ncbi:hypothetical protein [Archangium violaceum]|uniref:Uncharacterized protein n=1 Tax=Archangium violaceum Cb vi76 TaxID=1406225 RepID=A0A084SGT0_9BACT|nr:hypothetical protein [Archangium violaceum]KFA87665.1 hypothetical protein Q664_46080 [Archangium violaceum Cb vi76]
MTMTSVGSRRNDDTLVLGMNPHAQAEAEALQKSNPEARVTTVRDSFQNDHVRASGPDGAMRIHDLRTPDGIRRFVATLGLPLAQGKQVAAAIERAGEDARDELAQLALVWARAEKGGVVPSRLVLSGHSGGTSLWGEEGRFKNGVLTRRDFARLAEAMPRAAAGVEDLCLAACYNGGETTMEAWRELFPNLRTMWAYDGSAPGTFSGATAHLARWEKATRGSVDSLRPDLLRGLRKGENLAVWSRLGGHQTATVRVSTADLRARLSADHVIFERYFQGDAVVHDTQHGPLREHYNTLQALLGRPEISALERNGFERARDLTLRLLFHGNVAARFQETHRSSIQSGFRALGMRVPDFSRLGRKETLALIQSFEAELRRWNPRPVEAQRLLPLLTEGLRELQRSRIPDNWL